MKRIAFDIDGTIINLQDSLTHYFKKMYDITLPAEAFSRWSIEEATNIPYEQVLACVNVCIADIYRQTIYPGARGFIVDCFKSTGKEVLFITNRWDKLNTYKLLDRLFYDVNYGVIFVEGSKIDVLKKKKVDIYIEDRIENAEEISNAGIFTILLERSWNQFGSKGSDKLVRVKDWFKLGEIYKEMENKK